MQMIFPSQDPQPLQDKLHSQSPLGQVNRSLAESEENVIDILSSHQKNGQNTDQKMMELKNKLAKLKIAMNDSENTGMDLHDSIVTRL